jgi:hypothetical protein
MSAIIHFCYIIKTIILFTKNYGKVKESKILEKFFSRKEVL